MHLWGGDEPCVPGVRVVTECILDKDAMRRRGRELRALFNKWDPIGVVDEHGPYDEYDCLLWPVTRLLEGGASITDITAHVQHELTDHFGLSAAPRGELHFAEQARRWYEDSWAGTRVPGSDAL